MSGIGITDRAAGAAASIDAYVTTGTSPTVAPHARARRYDSVHVLGAGAVGRALLRRLAGGRRRVVAVTDSTATVHDAAGVDVERILAWKDAGRPLCEWAGSRAEEAVAAIGRADADVVVDCTATDLSRRGWADALGRALAAGVVVVSAAKAALCEAGPEWLSGGNRTRVGCNAVLGGTGRRFVAELPDLRRRCSGAAIVGNASTTAIIEVIERGGSLAEGIAYAQRLGFLEPDPELDLRGTDAAVKLAIVAGVITGRRVDPLGIDAEDLRSVDAMTLRGRARRGATTRLVARLGAAGELRVGYEEIRRASLLAVPCGRVLYEYRLGRNERRFHIGDGVGADATAAAAYADVCTLAAAAAARAVRPEVR